MREREREREREGGREGGSVREGEREKETMEKKKRRPFLTSKPGFWCRQHPPGQVSVWIKELEGLSQHWSCEQQYTKITNHM